MAAPIKPSHIETAGIDAPGAAASEVVGAVRTVTGQARRLRLAPLRQSGRRVSFPDRGPLACIITLSKSAMLCGGGAYVDLKKLKPL